MLWEIRMAYVLGDHVLYVWAVELGGNNSKGYNLNYLRCYSLWLY